MDHTEFIVEIKNVISQDFINKIIPLINKKAKKNLKIGFAKIINLSQR